MKRAASFVISALLGGAAILTAGATGVRAEAQLAPVSVEVISSTATVSGTIVPYKEVTLAAQIPGEVMFIGGREGEGFLSGQALVSIDDTAIQARRRAAVASAMAAEAAMRDANVQYNRELWSPRAGKTTGMGFPSMMDQFFAPVTGQSAGPNNPWVDRGADLYSRARGMDEARSQLLGSRAQIEEIDSKLRDATLNAPFDGVITQKLVEVGTTVQPGTPLLKYAHVAYLRIQSEVPVRLVASLTKGMVVPARLDIGGGIEIPARVAQIFPKADEQRHTVTVKFDLPQGVPGGPGMYAEVQIPDQSSQAVRLPTVPRDAIFQRGSLPAVIAVKDGKMTLRLVRVGAPLANGKLSILSGLEGIEQVVVAPPAQLAAMPMGAAVPSGSTK